MYRFKFGLDGLVVVAGPSLGEIACEIPYTKFQGLKGVPLSELKELGEALSVATATLALHVARGAQKALLDELEAADAQPILL